ncbi:Down syndrome cell adhesion molecule-like protein 1 [Blattella germanica]|nr:Down syndrome cell adhesion molecule-like protein 1 [Blattella germanica]
MVLVRPLQSVLQFPRVQPEDAGRYICVVSNIMGEDRREITLNVITALTAHIRPQQQVVDAGTPATFNCSVQGGSGGTHISWFKDARPLMDSPRVSILQQGEVLLLRNVRKSDRGMYQCMSRSGDETVAPELQSTFIEQTLQPGPPVSLRCAASGNPPPRITWLLDGGELMPRGYVLGSFLDSAGDVISHLNISSVRVQHGGLYTCVARNVLGAVQHSATLNIYGPPSARAPQNLTVVAGLDVYLRCPVAGFPISSVTWQRAGDILPTHLRHRVFPNGTLLIREVEGSTDRGEYSCSVSNQQGQSAHGRLYLDVMTANHMTACGQLTRCFTSIGYILYYADINMPTVDANMLQSVPLYCRAVKKQNCYRPVAPSWLIEPQDISVLFQHPVSLHCQANGFPTPAITWMKAKGDQPGDYISLESGPRLIISGNGSVLIRAVDPSHEGHYTCQASNGIGSGLSKVIFLRVNVPAHFRSRAVNQSGVAGEGIVLVCEAEGDLPLRVAWSASHRPLNPSLTQTPTRETQHGVTSELHLEALSRRDAGPYRCSARNDFGQDEMIVYLTVKGHAPISHYVVQFREEEPTLGGGMGSWNNVTVGGSIRKARLGALRPATSYKLRLLAVNEVGAGPPSEPTLALTSQEAPSGPPIDVSVEAASPESLLVKWQTNLIDPSDFQPPLLSYSNGEILGYQVGYREAPGSNIPSTPSQQTRTVRGRRLEVMLTNLRQFTRYEVSVCAFNQIGSGPASPTQFVTTLEGDMPPQDLRCSAVSPQSVRVRWAPPPPEHRNGIIEGYKVLYKHINPRSGGAPDVEVKKTTNLETNLHGLAKFANYSVRVLAFTTAGEGVRSNPVHCTTEEDVPGPPEQIKALPMTSDSIMVAWTRPLEPNGNIIKYNVYYHSLQHKDEHKETVFGDRELTYEVRRLKEFQQYEFWVTASTIIGEGQSSVKVPQAPVSRVPARIASFSHRVVAGTGQNILLPCHAVGLPAPNRTWRGPTGNTITSNVNRHRILPDGALAVGPLRPEDAGNYSCLSKNVFGNDEVTYGVTVQVSPGPPLLTIPATTTRSLTLQWRLPDNGGSPVTGYTLNYKREFGEWQEVAIDPDRKTYTLDNVKCGSSYQLFLTAINSVGTPKVPAQEDLMLINSTSVTLFLEAWPSGGCPLQYFVVEYRSRGQKTWTLVSNNIQQEELVIPDLSPATWYAIRVAAHNDAGSSVQEFVFATKTRTGVTLKMYRN